MLPDRDLCDFGVCDFVGIMTGFEGVGLDIEDNIFGRPTESSDVLGMSLGTEDRIVLFRSFIEKSDGGVHVACR